MTEYGLPLFELFTRLRQADLPLGIDEYKLLLQALEAGFGAPDLDTLAQLCRTLWVKSDEDRYLFDRHFQQIVAQSIVNNAPQPSTVPSSQPIQDMNPVRLTSSEERAPSSNRALNTEQKAVQAVLHIASEDELPYSRFDRSDEYFPVTRRQMKQSWRYLRRPVREGPPVELDLEKTVDRVGNQGLLLEPVFMPRRINRAELLLLIDQGGSMVSFHALSRRLAETALRGGRLGNANVYYFRNSPAEHFFLDPSHEDDELVLDVLQHLHYARVAVLIFSDAGAARGRYNHERYIMTKEFLDRLKQYARYTVWLNPMPNSRWTGTTAEKIAQLIPMFDISRRGLDNAISVLRGRFIPRMRS